MKQIGLEPLRRPAFRYLVGGQTASNVGDAFYAVALPWYVLAAHGGALLLGELLAAYGIARTATLVIGGQVSDRIRPWNTMLIADLARAVALAALALAAAIGPARIWLLMPIAVVAGAGEGIFLPASFAIIPDLLPDEQLQGGNAISSGGAQLAMLIGPALGGVMVGLTGPSTAFAIDAASFLLSALSLVAVSRRSAAGDRPATGADPTAAARGRSAPVEPTLRDAVRSSRLLPLLFALNIVANLGSGGTGEVTIPALAHGPFHTHVSGYGLLIASWAAGGLVGTIAVARSRPYARPAVVASFVFLAYACLIAIVPFSGGPGPAVCALFCAGATLAFANVLTGTAFQRWAPRHLLGRLTSITLLGSFGIFPVSVLLAGIVDHSYGPSVFMPLAGGALAISVLLALTQPEWRNFGAAADLPPGAPDRPGRR